jgi:DNA-directed RNA polymerase II subunit RPB1
LRGPGLIKLVELKHFCLQQAVNGRRIANGFKERTLPHFTRHDLSPAAHGFVSNSFVNGAVHSFFLTLFKVESK